MTAGEIQGMVWPICLEGVVSSQPNGAGEAKEVVFMNEPMVRALLAQARTPKLWRRP